MGKSKLASPGCTVCSATHRIDHGLLNCRRQSAKSPVPREPTVAMGVDDFEAVA